MSVIEPTIDDLLSVTDENRYLLCEIAARRARDINDMMRNQHNRAEQLADIEDLSAFLSNEDGHAPNPLSIAFDEIAPKKDEEGRIVGAGDLSFDERSFRLSLGMPYVEPEVVDEPESVEDAADQDGEEALAVEEELTVEDIAGMLEGMDD